MNRALYNGENENSIKTGRWFLTAACIAVLTVLDQVTKVWAEKYLADGPVDIIRGVFQLRYLENRGAAFGILQNQRWFFLILTAAFLAAAVFFLIRIPKTRRYQPIRLVCVLMTAGAVGNLIDRVKLEYVRDFLYFQLIDFPIFNVADIYVTISAFLLFILVLFYYKDEDFSFLGAGKKDE